MDIKPGSYKYTDINASCLRRSTRNSCGHFGKVGIFFYLWLLAEVGRELQAGDTALAISHNDDGVHRVKLNACWLGLGHSLKADGFKFVDTQVKHMHL